MLKRYIHIHTCMHTYIHTYIPAYNTYIQTYNVIYIYTLYIYIHYIRTHLVISQLKPCGRNVQLSECSTHSLAKKEFCQLPLVGLWRLSARNSDSWTTH